MADNPPTSVIAETIIREDMSTAELKLLNEDIKHQQLQLLAELEKLQASELAMLQKLKRQGRDDPEGSIHLPTPLETVKLDLPSVKAANAVAEF